jgi:hypothetical protein
VPVNRGFQLEQETSEQDAFRRIVGHALGLLPVFRKVFILCAIRGFTIEEAAAVLRTSPAAVALRLARARREIDIRLGLTSKQACRAVGGDHGSRDGELQLQFKLRRFSMIETRWAARPVDRGRRGKLSREEQTRIWLPGTVSAPLIPWVGRDL